MKGGCQLTPALNRQLDVVIMQALAQFVDTYWRYGLDILAMDTPCRLSYGVEFLEAWHGHLGADG